MSDIKLFVIVAFGALNQGSYDMFSYWLSYYGAQYGLGIDLRSAGAYPNAQAETVPGRPLRGDALKDPVLQEELYKAVAGDARALGTDVDLYCMPCLSMVGFQAGVERALGKSIVSLADSLARHYAGIEKLGVIHMRPAHARIDEIFGDKAVRPTDKFAQKLLSAEENFKQSGDSHEIESLMYEITQDFANDGLTHVLYARADAPYAQNNIVTSHINIKVESYFEILAQSIAQDLVRSAA